LRAAPYHIRRGNGHYPRRGSAAASGALDQATTINIICNTMTIEASTVAPVGVSVRGINPAPGKQE